ncbi:hypothetical protein [Salipaludibacillus sp. CF4.18]|uniref:hypothetical protein n=1 Tax=Salipaludibacillus sp. CF4.18 TaxID=3373081 RepID=UPI003EE4B261
MNFKDFKSVNGMPKNDFKLDAREPNYEDWISESVNHMRNQTEKMISDLIQHLNISFEDLGDRVEIQEEKGVKNYYADGKLVITEYPVHIEGTKDGVTKATKRIREWYKQ